MIIIIIEYNDCIDIVLNLNNIMNKYDGSNDAKLNWILCIQIYDTIICNTWYVLNVFGFVWLCMLFKLFVFCCVYVCVNFDCCLCSMCAN